ncbi:hypothetical protein GGI12_003324 [Dipsacomyces acuminosporus]|nr:hypothetical protein GGI12_003324 [Dipsacomyces acuminosporus]
MAKFSFSLGLLAAASIASVSAQVVDSHASIKTFNPKLDHATFQTYDSPLSFSTGSTLVPASFTGPASGDKLVEDKVKVAIEYLKQKHNIAPENIKVTDAYTDSNTQNTFVYVKQIVGGIAIHNAVGNVNIDRQNRVISSSQSFASNEAVAKAKSSATAFAKRADNNQSILKAFQALAGYTNSKVGDNVTVAAPQNNFVAAAPGQTSTSYTISNIPKEAAADGSATAKKTYILLPSGELKASWKITLDQDKNWWSSVIDAETQKVHAINNWVSNAESYNVFPKELNTPDEGPRKVVSNPANTKASPKGWVTKDTTVGNNVWAQDNPTGGNAYKNNHRPKAAAGNKFDYPLDLKKEPTTYIDAAITQLFYTVNTMHDLSYLYGFDEAAGNFQDVNYSGRGKGKDAVIANAQDGSGTNNANFATPPDGQNGRMRMYVWDVISPKRDGDFAQDIVAHEFTHGISNRLTGGPANADCLNDGEAGGMGEGWSDTVANILRLKSGDTRKKDIILGKFVYGKGIRRYPYSTSMTTNPSTYKLLNEPNYKEVHAIGEVWAEILYEVVWNIIDANGGKIGDLFARDLKNGNSLALQLILDGMKIQPCNPTFINARDAILQAEKTLTGGKNKCAIWKGFAKRGLGPKAKGSDSVTHVEDFTLPAGC